MEAGIRPREFLARPRGRADVIQFQALNPRRAALAMPGTIPTLAEEAG